MKKAFSLIVLAAASLTGLSQAATIVQTETFAFVPNGSQVLTFDQFDSNSGLFTLQSVTISITLNKTGGSLQVDNDSATAGTINLTHQIQASLASSLGATSLLNTTFQTIGATSALTATNTVTGQPIGVTSGDPTNEFNNTASSDFFALNPSDASASDSGTVNDLFESSYVGTGTFTNTITASQLVNVSGLGGLQQAFTVSGVSGSVTITYSYIPEPSTALLGALGVLGLLRRRR